MSTTKDFYCIYTGKSCPEDERSDEHIIPYSLGGSNQLVVRDVSRKGNNDAGSSADALLINSWFISQERWRLKLKSKNGVIPPIEFEGTIDVNGRTVKATYSIDHNSRIELVTIPEVDCNWTTGKINVNCDPKQLNEILMNISKKATKKGLTLSKDQLKSQTGEVIRIENPEMKMQLTFDTLAFVPGFLKMALATGHRLLGYKWSQSTEADLIRNAIWEKDRNKLINYKIPGSVWPNSQFAAKDIFNVGKDKHVLAISNTGPLVFYAKLFGEFDGLIRLSESVWNGPEINIGDFHIIVADATSRKIVEYSFGEFLILKNAGRL